MYMLLRLLVKVAVSVVFAGTVLGISGCGKDDGVNPDEGGKTETIVIQPGPDDGKDAGIESYSPNNNSGDSPALEIGHTNLLPKTEDRFLIKFDIPFDLEIVSASLFLYGWYSSNDLVSPTVVDVKRITESWDEYTVTWDNQPSSDLKVFDTKTPSFLAGEEDWCEWDITDLVTGWANGDYNNYGIMLVSRADDLPIRHYVVYTSDIEDFGYEITVAPRLEITVRSN